MSIYVALTLGVGVGLGALSNFIKVRWSILLVGVWISVGYFLHAWRSIDVAVLGFRNTLAAMAIATVLYVVPVVVYHVIPVLVGRYSYKLVDMLAERWPRG